MAKYRLQLPQLDGAPFLTDGGMETSLIFLDGIDLPYFASFVLLQTDEGRQQLLNYYRPYVEIARSRGTGFILETATWRASQDWGDKLGLDKAAMAKVNKDAVNLLMDIRRNHENPATPIVISGNLGPRGDGYVAGEAMTPDEAMAYHLPQIEALTEAGADMIAAITMTNMEEATGITMAAQHCNIPVCIGFTVETDGKLPTGQLLKDAISGVDALTANGPAYYMINCAHPTHFQDVLETGEDWLGRIRGIRANASKMSHAELDEATELDAGNPQELGQQYRELSKILPNLAVFGGCCGTDHRHIEAIHHACAA